MPAIVKVVGAEHPIGASRAAAQISERSGLEVTWSDVRAIADARPELLPVVVADRLRWTAGSKTREETAAALGVTVRELRKMPLERGPLGRYDTEQVRALAADETAAATAAEVIADRRLGPD
ncbi:hypothetical protein APASM_2054 [Actinosynnema pretiosum subsp. pretiosum]|nr:hypothetical protein APASM_2054 [Actinosynnema pretiosum subsp. pretiosum]